METSKTNSFQVNELPFLDPKGGDLCLYRIKSEEILMEVRSLCDVQIQSQIWV